MTNSMEKMLTPDTGESKADDASEANTDSLTVSGRKLVAEDNVDSLCVILDIVWMKCLQNVYNYDDDYDNYNDYDADGRRNIWV